MTKSVQLNNFTDFDRLLIGKNFIITVLCATLAFIITYLELYIPIISPSFSISLSIALMLIVAVSTRNIASTLFVTIIGLLGFKPVHETQFFYVGYIITVILTLLIIGYLADRLQLVMKWVKFNFLVAAIFSIISIVTGIFFNTKADLYWQRGIEIGNGGDLDIGEGIPVLDLAVLSGLLLLIAIFAFILRGQILLPDTSLSKYKIFGWLFLLLGHLVTIIPLILFYDQIDLQTMQDIANVDSQLIVLDNLFLHEVSGPYTVFTEPFNIFFVMALTFTFIMIGVNLLMIGKNMGNLEGVRGKSSAIYYAAPLGFVIFFLYGFFHPQNLIYPNGFYVSVELYSVFATAIWTVFFINHVVARIVMMVLDRFY